MEIPRTRILSISPRLKRIGYAYLEDEELIDYGIKSIRQTDDINNVFILQTKIINSLIKQIDPELVVVENIDRKEIIENLRLTVIMQNIRKITLRSNLEYRDYKLETVLKSVCRTIDATKRELAKNVVSKYPELSDYIIEQYSRREQYHMIIFIAIACGLTYLDYNADRKIICR